MKALVAEQTIQFFDWQGEIHAGTIKEAIPLRDDFGEFYLVRLETNQGECCFEIEGCDDLFIGEPWNS